MTSEFTRKRFMEANIRAGNYAPPTTSSSDQTSSYVRSSSPNLLSKTKLEDYQNDRKYEAILQRIRNRGNTSSNSRLNSSFSSEQKSDYLDVNYSQNNYRGRSSSPNNNVANNMQDGSASSALNDKLNNFHSRHLEFLRRRQQENNSADYNPFGHFGLDQIQASATGTDANGGSTQNRPTYSIRNVPLRNLEELRETIAIRRQYYRERLFGKPEEEDGEEPGVGIEGGECSGENENRDGEEPSSGLEGDEYSAGENRHGEQAVTAAAKEQDSSPSTPNEGQDNDLHRRNNESTANKETPLHRRDDNEPRNEQIVNCNGPTAQQQVANKSSLPEQAADNAIQEKSQETFDKIDALDKQTQNGNITTETLAESLAQTILTGLNETSEISGKNTKAEIKISAYSSTSTTEQNYEPMNCEQQQQEIQPVSETHEIETTTVSYIVEEPNDDDDYRGGNVDWIMSQEEIHGRESAEA